MTLWLVYEKIFVSKSRYVFYKIKFFLVYRSQKNCAGKTKAAIESTGFFFYFAMKFLSTIVN